MTHILAKHCDLEAGEFLYNLGNCHIYDDHIDSLNEQIKREPYEFPRLEIKNKYKNIEDYKVDDFELSNYKYHEMINMEMRK